MSTAYEKQLAYSVFSSICELLEGISNLSQANVLIINRSSDMIECEIEDNSPIAEYYFPDYGQIRLCEFINYMILPHCKLIEPNYELAPQCTTLVHLRCYGSTIVFNLREDDKFFILKVMIKLQLSDYASFIDYMEECGK